MGAYFCRCGRRSGKLRDFMGRRGLCMLVALLGEMNAVIMLATSCKYWDVNKKHHVLVRNHIHFT